MSANTQRRPLTGEYFKHAVVGTKTIRSVTRDEETGGIVVVLQSGHRVPLELVRYRNGHWEISEEKE